MFVTRSGGGGVKRVVMDFSHYRLNVCFAKKVLKGTCIQSE